MRKLNKYSGFISALIITIFFSSMSFAQNTTAPVVPAQASSTNQLAMFTAIVAIVLAFVIWGLGQVLITLGKQVLEKSKSGDKILTILVLIIALTPITSNAQDNPAVILKSNYGGLDATTFWILFSVIMIEMAVIAFILFSIRRIQAELMPQIEKKVEVKTSWWKNLDKKIFTRAVAVEREEDILLDHNYDGIKELDNALPPWWKYGFYISIAAAFIYMFHFHVLGSGKNPTEEYQAEMASAQLQMEAYNAKNVDRVDENNFTMPTAVQIASGKDIFIASCFACHGKLGEGGAGPNLTDDYWIHKGSFKDVYLSIKHGYPDKGMQAWDKNFSPKEIVNLAGYIKSIRGTNPPNAKAAQGDLFTEDSIGVSKTPTDNSVSVVNK
ncbi:MAG: cbb3-type cytochrome c oxidase N-terminal domain-containing protein [Ferruginibacter sp.]